MGAMRHGRLLLALALLAVAAAPAMAGEPPARVVSMNVCTDQLAMLMAAPGQLLSVSSLAADPGSSALAGQSAQYRLNHAQAEEIFLLQPDLVVTGTFSTQATDSLLQRLGFRVEKFAPETSFDDVRNNMLRMGDLLGQQVRAREMVARLDEGLRALAATAIPGLTVATYGSNSYSAGADSLSEAVIEAAGLANLGTRLGIKGAGRLPLELLVLSMPDIIASDTPVYDAPALAQEYFAHPAYRAVRERAYNAAVPAADWICGGPFNLAAAAILQDAAHRVARDRERARR